MQETVSVYPSLMGKKGHMKAKQRVQYTVYNHVSEPAHQSPTRKDHVRCTRQNNKKSSVNKWSNRQLKPQL